MTQPKRLVSLIVSAIIVIFILGQGIAPIRAQSTPQAEQIALMFSRNSRVFIKLPQANASEMPVSSTTIRDISGGGSWSAATHTLAYAVYEDGVYLVDQQGLPKKLLVSSDSDNYSSPSWSPDGKYLVLVREIKDKDSCCLTDSIIVSDLQGKIRTVFGPYDSDNQFWLSSVEWSPDGKFVALDGHLGGTFGRKVIELLDTACLTTLDSSCSTRELTITDNSSRIVVASGVDHGGSWSAPTWSPDGSHLAFTCDSYGGLCSINRDGTNFQVLLEGPVGDKLAWSPDGKYIAYSLGVVRLFDFAQRREFALTSDSEYEVSDPIWITLPGADFLLSTAVATPAP